MTIALNLTRRGILQGSAAAVAATQFMPKVATAAATDIPRISGLPWVSGGTDYTTPTLESFRARPLDVRVTFGSRNTWQQIRTAYGFSGQMALNKTGRVVATYVPFPVEQNPKSGGVEIWKAAARGDYDAHHEAAAISFANFGRPLIFRIGHEWNARYAHWNCCDKEFAGYYKDYFRRVADILRRRNPGALIDWNSVKGGEATAGLQTFYPGSDYVDFIGCDKYDFWPASTTQAIWDKDLNTLRLGGPNGVGSFLAYAKSEGKPLSFAEWGVIKGSANSGGDNPFFVQKMIEFFRANAASIGFEGYFNINFGNWVHRLQDNPLAGAAYLRGIA